MHCCRIGEYLLRGRAFCLCTGRGISEEDVIYPLYMAAVHIWLVVYGMVQNYSYKCRKRAYKKIYREDGILLGNTRNCAHRAEYAVVEGLYIVSGSIRIYRVVPFRL